MTQSKHWKETLTLRGNKWLVKPTPEMLSPLGVPLLRRVKLKFGHEELWEVTYDRDYVVAWLRHTVIALNLPYNELQSLLSAARPEESRRQEAKRRQRQVPIE